MDTLPAVASKVRIVIAGQPSQQIFHVTGHIPGSDLVVIVDPQGLDSACPARMLTPA